MFLTNNNREFTNNLGNLVGRYPQDFGFLAMTCERGRYHNAGIKTGKLDARILPFRHFQAHALIFKRSMFHCYQNKTKLNPHFMSKTKVLKTSKSRTVHQFVNIKSHRALCDALRHSGKKPLRRTRPGRPSVTSAERSDSRCTPARDSGNDTMSSYPYL